MATAKPSKTTTSWNAALHPRDPAGRFRKVGLKPGYYPYRRGSDLHYYYINDAGDMVKGVNLLCMSSRYEERNQFRGVDDAEADERIHLVDSGDGEQMAVAANRSGVSGVVYPDRIAPPEPFSFARYSGQNERVDRAGSQYEKNFGGEPDQLADRADGYVYDTLEAQRAYRVNDEAFADQNNPMWTVSADEVARQTVEARHWYQNELGMSEGQARNQDVYVYVDGRNGRVHVTPTVSIGRDGVIRQRHSPNTKSGGGSIKLRLSDVTRKFRSMQVEGIDNIEMTIVKGVDRDAESGVKPKRTGNALHFRSNQPDRTTGETQIVWGTMQQNFNDYTISEARSRFLNARGEVDPEKKAAYRREDHARRAARAERYENPKSQQSASNMLRALYTNTPLQQGDGSYSPEDIELGKDRITYVNPNRPINTVYRTNGQISHFEARNAKGFTALFNHGRAANQQISEDMVSERDDGGFDIHVPLHDGGEKVVSYTNSGKVMR